MIDIVVMIYGTAFTLVFGTVFSCYLANRYYYCKKQNRRESTK